MEEEEEEEWSASSSCRFTPDTHSWYRFNRRPDGHQSLFGLLGKEKDLLTLLGIESRSFFCPARSHVTNGIYIFFSKNKKRIHGVTKCKRAKVC